MKIKNYLATPIISNTIPINDFDFLSEYRQNSVKLDKHFIKMYGNLSLDEELEGATDTLTKTNVTNEITNCLYTHREQLNRIYEINNLEYNPLYNVDGTTTTTSEIGERVETNTIGEQNNTTTIGALEVTSNLGEQKNSDTEGIRHTETTNKATGYNGNTMMDDNKSINDSNEVTNSSLIGARKDTTSTGEQINKNKIDEKTDTIKHNAYTDKVTEVRRGNIGVTKSTELIQSQYDTWKNIDFWNLLYTLIISSITIPFYE